METQGHEQLRELPAVELGLHGAGISAAFADNFAEVPQFVNEAKGDLHLGPTSPCRDRGVPVEKGAAATDMDGDERPTVGPTDVGPDEVP